MINPKHPHGDCTFSGRDFKQIIAAIIMVCFWLPLLFVGLAVQDLFVDLLKRTGIRKPDPDNFYDWKYFRGGRP